MIDLALLVIANRVGGRGPGPIIATRILAANGDVLRDHLCSPANQWRLASTFADIVALRPAGERCDARLRLALGVRCHASLHVKANPAAGVLRTAVRVGFRTVAWVTWILTPGRGTTELDVAVAQPPCPPCPAARRPALDRAAPRHRACGAGDGLRLSPRMASRRPPRMSSPRRTQRQARRCRPTRHQSRAERGSLDVSVDLPRQGVCR